MKTTTIKGWTGFKPYSQGEASTVDFVHLAVCHCSRRRDCERTGACAELMPRGSLDEHKLMVELGLKGAKHDGFDYRLTTEQEIEGEKLVDAYMTKGLKRCKPVTVIVQRRKK